MKSESSINERIRGVFRDAAQRAVVPLNGEEIHSLTQRVLLALETRPDVRPRLGEIGSQIVLRPSSDIAERMAKRLRLLVGAGDVEPLYNLPSLLEDQLNVFLFPIEHEKLAGGCALIGGSGFIFVSAEASNDALFTCAHELGHLAALCVRKGSIDGAALDPADDGESSVKGPYEHFADAFASELLVPERGLRVALRKVRELQNAPTGPLGDIELLYLSRIFGVHFLAMAKRCERVRLLPRGGAASLNQFLIEKFGGPERRAEAVGLPPRTMIKIAPAPQSIEFAVAGQNSMAKTRPEQTPTSEQRKVKSAPARL